MNLTAIFAGCAALSGCDNKIPHNDPPEDMAEQEDVRAFKEADCNYKEQIKRNASGRLDSAAILPMSCYLEGVFNNNETIIQAVERGFKSYKIDPALAQETRNHALLFTTMHFPSQKSISTALRFGADINAGDENGLNLKDYIYSNSNSLTSLEKWEIFRHLQSEYDFDIGFLKNDLRFTWSGAIKNDTPVREEAITAFLKDMKESYGINLEDLTEPESGINLLHIAAYHGYEKLLRFIHDENLHFDLWDRHGHHVLDYARPQFRAILSETYGIKKEGPPPGVSRKPINEAVHSFLRVTTDNYVDLGNRESLEQSVSPASDFSAYRNIQYNPALTAGHHVTPVLIIAETSPFSYGGKPHIQDTSRVAAGISKALGFRGWSDLIAIRQRPGTMYQNNHTDLILSRLSDNYVIISNSNETRLNFLTNRTKEQNYQLRSSYKLKNIDKVDRADYIYYNSAGNYGISSCIQIDNIPFCLQASEPSYHPLTAVRIGAVEINPQDKKMTVPEYSNMRPALCAAIPLKSGEFYKGTSFSAPAAAAVETRLANIFARSEVYPEGMIHEDIFMAMTLTAQTHGLTDAITNETAPVFYNSAGIGMTNRCGAGVIQEQKAADLLSQMIRWTRENPDVQPTQSKTLRIELASGDKTKHTDWTVYTMQVPENGILTQLRAGIPFNRLQRGAALLQIEDLPMVTLDLSYSGLTTEFRLAGHQFKAGDTIKLYVTRPLEKTGFVSGKDRGFIDLRMINTDSPVALALEQKAETAAAKQKKENGAIEAPQSEQLILSQ